MFPNVFGSPSSYFYLPVDDDDEYGQVVVVSRAPSSDRLDSPVPPTSAPPLKSKSVISEILSHNDLYHILGVNRNTRLDTSSLRRAYLARSKACHPDKFPDNVEATRAFQRVSMAYDILSNPSSKRLYDARSSRSTFDLSSEYPLSHPEETLRTVIIGVFNDLIDGDVETVRHLLRAAADLNPSLRLGEDHIDSVIHTLKSIRERALTCRTCILALHDELTRLLELYQAFRQLSYFDLRRRSHLSIQLARLTVALPIVIEHALRRQQHRNGIDPLHGDAIDDDGLVILNKRAYVLLQRLVRVLERLEGILK